MINFDVHSIYSTKRSILKLEQIINFAKQNDQKAIALTDDDGLYGSIYYYNLCMKNGLKPIIGSELNICESVSIKDKSNLRITLIAKNRNGYSNLCKLITKAYNDGFYYVPRIDWSILQENYEDLICILNGTANVVTEPFLNNQIEYAKLNLERISNIFLDQFCISIHPFSNKQYHKFISWANEIEPLNTIVTNSARFLISGDFKFYDLLRCSGKNEIFLDKKRVKSNQDEYLKTEQEIKDTLKSVLDDDALNDKLKLTLDICDDIDLSFEKKIFFPEIDLGNETSVETFFKKLLNKKWKEKLPLLKYDTIDNYKKRIKYETETVIKLGYAEYFVIVASIVDFAKQNDIPIGDGRGSAAGCLLSYILGITKVDPLRYNLIFERFLDPSGKRVTPPDIDIDFSDTGRKQIVEFIVNKWGANKVAAVGNLSTLAFKSSIKDTAKTLSIPFEIANNYTKFIPKSVHSMQDATNYNHLNRQMKNDDTFKNLLELADGIKGSMKTLSTHAAGIVISPNDITEFTPIQKTKDSDISVLTTQLDKDEIESLGLVKIDILGLTALRTIQNTLRYIKNRHNKDINLDEVDLDDKNIYKIIQKGLNLGLFQMESQGMTELAQRLKVSSVREMCALISLYRPAVLESNMHEIYVHNKFNKNKKIIHPKLNEITKETYGVLCIDENTDILLSDGTQKPIKYLSSNEQIQSLSLNTKKIVNDICLNVGKTKTSDGLQIELENGSKIIVTDDHPIYTFYGFKEAKDLNIQTDLVGSPLQCISQTNNNQIAHWLGDNKDVSYFIGLLIGDASITKSGIALCCGNLEQNCDKIIAFLNTKLKNISYRKYWHCRSWYLHIKSNLLENDKNFGNRKTKLSKLIDDLDIRKTALNKDVPIQIIKSNDTTRHAFLAGVLDSDGCIKKYKNNHTLIYLSSKSKNLLSSIRLLLYQSGILHQISEKHNRIIIYDVVNFMKCCSSYSILKNNTLISNQYGYGFSKIPASELLKFQDTKKLVSRSTFSKLKYNKCNFVTDNLTSKIGIRNDDIRFFKIKSISKVYNRNFYGISVQNNHNLIANGIIIHNCYQEQVMQASVIMAGFSFSEADTLRKAIAKKKEDDIPILKKKFIIGCIKNNISERDAIEIFSIFENASYLFNQSHGLSYALIAAKTAWLKTYYPIEYMCAYLNSESGDLEKVKKIIDECTSYLKIKILPPDINKSFNDFTIESDNTIRYGFSAIKSIGENALVEIINTREKIGKFDSITQFVEKINNEQLKATSNKIETLIKLGVFNSLDTNRKFILDRFIELMRVSKVTNNSTKNKKALFNADFLAKKIKIEKDFSQYEKRSLEFEHFGISFS